MRCGHGGSRRALSAVLAVLMLSLGIAPLAADRGRNEDHRRVCCCPKGKCKCCHRTAPPGGPLFEAKFACSSGGSLGLTATRGVAFATATRIALPVPVPDTAAPFPRVRFDLTSRASQRHRARPPPYSICPI